MRIDKVLVLVLGVMLLISGVNLGIGVYQRALIDAHVKELGERSLACQD